MDNIYDNLLTNFPLKTIAKPPFPNSVCVSIINGISGLQIALSKSSKHYNCNWNNKLQSD